MTKYSDSVDDRMDELMEAGRNVCGVVADLCISKGKPCEINFSIDPSIDFNAFAELITPDTRSGRLFGGSYQVTVNKGVVYKLAYFFEMATSILQKLKKDKSIKKLHAIVHNNQNEIVAKQIAATNFFNFDLNRDLFAEDTTNELFSRIEARFWPFWFEKRKISNAALIFLKKAFVFLVLHECAHVSRGHLEYIGSRSQMPAIPLDDLTSYIGLSEEMIKAIEIDADHQALFNILYETSKLNISDDVLQKFEHHLLVVALLFGVFDLRVRTASTYKGASHPDPDLRYYLTTRYMLTALNGMTGRDYKQSLESIFERVILYVVQIQRELGVLGGGYSVYLAACCDDQAGKVFVKSAREYFNSALNLQDKWVHRVGESQEAVADLLFESN